MILKYSLFLVVPITLFIILNKCDIVYQYSKIMTEKEKGCDEPFGTVLGHSYGGVAIFSNSDDFIQPQKKSPRESSKSYIKNLFMGIKWQCVEFARRYLYVNYGMVFSEVRFAYEIFSLRFLHDVSNERLLPLHAFPNGGKQAPISGSMLIWDAAGEFEITGHVAIITEVYKDKIRVVEQNVINTLLATGQKWTRELRMTVTEDGNYFVFDTFYDTKILGWMIQTERNDNSLPRPINTEYFGIQEEIIEDKCQFKEWLSKDNCLEHAYLQVHQDQTNSADNHEYFTITTNAERELNRATNELHLMFMQATNTVLKDDNLLRLFNIPEVLWKLIRLSWQERRHQMITGRLDFSLDERGLKVYEYNADSSSCHTESAVVIEKWIQHSGIKTGYNPSKKLRKALANAWKRSDAMPFVHILKDNSVAEENYHALFMQCVLKQAGYKSRIINNLSELHWNSQGRLLDVDDREVNCVWKTWAWETVVERLRQELIIVCNQTNKLKNQVQLLDVLMHPNIRVFEPLWTLIPSNKAILPILWRLFPNHPYLLNTDFEITEPLRKSGYVVKPISGRCGSNIKMINHEGELLDESAGNFSERSNIYQELWCLPKVAGRYLQMCAFTAGGKYSGACLRSDNSLVVKHESFIQPLVVQPGQFFLTKTRYRKSDPKRSFRFPFLDFQ